MRYSWRILKSLFIGVGLCWLVARLPAYAAAADLAAEQHQDDVVIIATRIPEPALALPVSVDRVDRTRLRQGQLQVNLSESLMAVPGVSAQERQNYAQDLQLSVRGFGARSSFGVRGLRLYADGIPATMPDGQGQFSHFDLSAADRIEVLRGPFSALYGNSSGGVIALYTEDAPPSAQWTGAAHYGSFGTRRLNFKGMGQPKGINLVVDIAHFETDGFRDHSAATRDTVNIKARWALSAKSSLTLVANHLDLPEAQDPLGLTRAQLAAAPRQAGTNAVAYNARKSIAQDQLGALYQCQLTATDTLTALVYGGGRDTTQYQAVPKASERPLLAPGGVIELRRGYWGADLHLTAQRRLGASAMRWAAGISVEGLSEGRRGYLNFSGNQLGIEGALRRSESNQVYDLDEYLQVQWDPNQRWRTLMGLRNSLVQVRTLNHLAAAAPALSSTQYHALNPVAGLTYRSAWGPSWYASFGKGFETPTLNELAYRSTDGTVPGLNLGLQAARSAHYELGVKAASAASTVALTGFYIQTVDELAAKASQFGRTVYQNIPGTRRKGVEFEWARVWTSAFSTHWVYTHLQALTLQGTYLPAVPRSNLYVGLTWRHPARGLSATLEVIDRSKIFVDDRNSDAAVGYWLGNLHLDLEHRHRQWNITESLRVNNLGNRRYVGSVIVNDNNGRYFEPEPGRTAYVILTATRSGL